MRNTMISALKMTGGQDCGRTGPRESHDIERVQLRIGGWRNAAGMMAKYLAMSLAMLKVVSDPRVISICLPVSHHLDELGGVRVEIDHVAGLFGRLCAGIHGHGHIGLSKSGRIVRTVAGHRHQAPFGLVRADETQFRFGSRFSEENRPRPASAAIAAAVQWVVAG